MKNIRKSSLSKSIFLTQYENNVRAIILIVILRLVRLSYRKYLAIYLFELSLCRIKTCIYIYIYIQISTIHLIESICQSRKVEKLRVGETVCVVHLYFSSIFIVAIITNI